MIVYKNKDDDGVFGGIFGNPFNDVFSDSSSDDAKEEDKPLKTKAKTKKTTKTVDKTVTLERNSSRTFSVAKPIDENKKATPVDEQTLFTNASKFYENKKAPEEKPVEIENEVEVEVEIETKKVTAPIYSPTIFKSKIITKEEKEADKKKIDERGIAFAKTFIQNKDKEKDKDKDASKNKTRFVKPAIRPRTESVPYFKKVKRVKVKQAPTLRTRISGKSAIIEKKLEIIEGSDIRRKNPVVIIMGHVDHGKSTLLDYIRKTNIVDREVGGITQKMSAYEISHNDGKITFLDTPGHESFTTMRDRGARSADIAILIVSAEDGVKPQTLDALKSIQDANIPFFIGMSKIDKDGADIEKTKQSLAEHAVFVEGYGGDISYIPFSAKTGKGIDDLLDMITLMSDLSDIKAAYDVPATCIVIESGRDQTRGIHATMIVKNGVLKQGSFIVSNAAISPVRIVENFEGKTQKEFEPGQPLRLIGWSAEPKVGDIALMAIDKTQAELLQQEQQNMLDLEKELSSDENLVAQKNTNIRALYGLEKDDTWTLPIVLKADSVGTLDAVKQELSKIKLENIIIRIIRAETGDINENDIKLAQGSNDSVIVGYNTKVDSKAKNLANQLNLKIETFSIIYKLSEWLIEEAKAKAPKIISEESHGTLKVLKVFNANKTKQVLGGKVETGKIFLGDKVKIMRRENEIGRGEIVELQQARSQVKSVEAEYECGLMIDSKIEIVTGDVIAAFSIVEK